MIEIPKMKENINKDKREIGFKVFWSKKSKKVEVDENLEISEN